MRIHQMLLTDSGSWAAPPDPPNFAPNLAFVFASPGLLANADIMASVRSRCRGAAVIGASSAGEIHDVQVHDRTVSVTLVEFATTRLVLGSLPHASDGDSRDQGRRLAAQLPPQPAHVFVLFEGHDVNGSEVVAGLRAELGDSVGITGGLAADGPRFGRTQVVAGVEPSSVRGAAIGLYGPRLRVGAASMGGWDAFGPERRITRSNGNVLYELDGKPALATYKRYLGSYAERLPSSALLFPLSVRRTSADKPVLRTILACDDVAGSMIFAGDVPEGSLAQLMHANLDRLVSGAEGAAEASRMWHAEAPPGLAVLISCVGRRLVLKEYVEDEVLAVRRVLGEDVALAGFYSYGEISPFTPSARCELHNQTMTITTFTEV